MARFVLGARYACTTCLTRGIDRACRCSKNKKATPQILDLAAELLDDTTRELFATREPRPVQRRDIAAHLLRSKVEWAVSGLLALASLLVMDFSVPATAGTVVAALAFFASVLVGTRLFVFVLALLVRIALAIVFALLGLASMLVSGLAKRRDTLGARCFTLATRVLSFMSPDKTCQVRWPKVGAGATEVAGHLTGPLRPRVAEGVRGALHVADAELETFEITLASGERIAVVAGAGLLRVEEDAILGSTAMPRGDRLFAEGAHLDLASVVVTLRGGEWRASSSPAGEAAGFRSAPRARELVGTEDAPLEVALLARAR